MKNKPNIHVVDSIMGSGKTSAAINYINQADPDKHFIYVTPFLDEVKRIIERCPEKKFKQPSNIPRKIDSVKKLLKKGHNIVTTHSLFHMFDEEIIDLCYSQEYVLFLDEVTDVVRQHYIGEQDLKVLFEKFVDIDDYGTLVWKESQKNYKDQKFLVERNLCSMHSLIFYTNNILMWMFPVKIFNAFKESFILTYLFDAQMQKYYYDFYNLEYNHWYVSGDSIDTYYLTEEKIEYMDNLNYSQLINIIDNDRLNRIGDNNFNLTKQWYKNHEDDILLKTLKNNTYNFFYNITKSKADNCLWTTFKDYRNKIKGKGYTKGFLPSNARSTNEYNKRHNVAYLINKYFNPIIKQFFKQKDIIINEDEYALSEMLQFIWRSAIRNGEEITLYIPSSRMRSLLEQWIEENS